METRLYAISLRMGIANFLENWLKIKKDVCKKHNVSYEEMGSNKHKKFFMF